MCVCVCVSVCVCVIDGNEEGKRVGRMKLKTLTKGKRERANQ